MFLCPDPRPDTVLHEGDAYPALLVHISPADDIKRQAGDQSGPYQVSWRPVSSQRRQNSHKMAALCSYKERKVSTPVLAKPTEPTCVKRRAGSRVNPLGGLGVFFMQGIVWTLVSRVMAGPGGGNVEKESSANRGEADPSQVPSRRKVFRRAAGVAVAGAAGDRC